MDERGRGRRCEVEGERSGEEGRRGQRLRRDKGEESQSGCREVGENKVRR